MESPRMDLGIVFGFLGTWVLVCWAIFAGGDLSMFWDPRSFVLVAGGLTTIAFFCFPTRNVRAITAVVRRAFASQERSVERLVEDFVSYAEIARRDGILSLEPIANEMDDPFVARGLQMAVDGTDPESIEQIMGQEIDSIVDRHESGKSIFETLGRYAPALGMIGTLIGLVIMLRNMADPKSLGPGMALAMLTTLYGALFANAVCLPLADRLGRRSAEEVLYKTIVLHGVIAIQRGDNPRVVERKLLTFLPSSSRVRPFVSSSASMDALPGPAAIPEKEAA